MHRATTFVAMGTLAVGLLGAAGIAVASVLFLLLAGPIGALWAATAALAAGLAGAGRRLLILRSTSGAGLFR